MEKIIGNLSGIPQINGDLSCIGNMQGNLVLPDVVGQENYTGPYEVIPRLNEQMLETAYKTMTNNVTIHRIPVVETSNIYGGQTVVIG